MDITTTRPVRLVEQKAIELFGERTPAENEVIGLLVQARREDTRQAAKKVLLRARDICNSADRKANKRLPILRMEVYADLAKNERDLQIRESNWMALLDVAIRDFDMHLNPQFASLLLRKLVDYMQDGVIGHSLQYTNSISAAAKKIADLAIAKTDDVYHKSQVLSSKASLLRHAAKLSVTRDQQIEMAERAVRCAKKSLHLQSGWYQLLEVGCCLWEMAQFEGTDAKVNECLNDAERYFWASIDAEENWVNTFTLARFYRSTYQTLPFIQAFELYSKLEINKGEYYRASYLWGEGVLQLYYANYPKSMIEEHLDHADSLLERVIDSGYGNARHIIALGFVKAARGDVAAGMEIMRLLHPTDGRISWSDLANQLHDLKFDEKRLSGGFALGITQSSTWSKLGTYTRSFLNDPVSAIALYRVSLQLNPSNAVAMTNLATSLLHLGTEESLLEANRLISKVGSIADRRFRWWRMVREEIQEALADKNLLPKPVAPTKISFKASLNELKKTFDALKAADDRQHRGYELEKLVHALIGISLGNCRPSYRAIQTWFDSSVRQIDAAFCYFDHNYFRVEVKWQADPLVPDDIVLFNEKLRVAGVSGLLISMSGFAPAAIARAASFSETKEILLMDGDELGQILGGSPSFDEGIRLKRQFFFYEGKPFHKISQIVQDETTTT